jgi:hypothetical protein
MKENIRETVRKLLRLAKGKGPEAESARKHADVLMEKHGITIIDDSEDYREVVPGVSKNFWREQLLNGVARTLNCKLIKVERGKGRYDAVLVGYASDVVKAREIYDRLNLDLVVQCKGAFKDFNRVIDYDREEDDSIVPGISGGIFDEVFRYNQARVGTQYKDRFSKPEDADEVYLAWQRSFLSTASAEISQRLMNGPEKKRPRGPVVYAPEDKEDKSAMDAEIARILGDTKMLAKKFDKYSAQEIQRAAVQAAQRAARGVGVRVVSTERKLLTANSSFLAPPPPPPKPPEPSRWSELDL